MKDSLILVSGLLSNEKVWFSQIKNLNNLASINVVSPSQATPLKMVEEILKEAPERFALAGHSMGGWLCLELMRNAGKRVTKLCLLNTTAKPDTEIKKAKREEMIQEAMNGQFNELVKKMSDDFVYDNRIKNEVENMFLEVGKDAFVRQEKSMLLRVECQSILPSIRCPTLVIHAEKDKVFTLEDHQEMANNIPNAKLSIIKDCGHMSPMEKPNAINALMNSFFVS